MLNWYAGESDRRRIRKKILDVRDWNNPIMRLEKITYSQVEPSGRTWSISDFVLKDINLLVGKNASGKSMTLNVIGGIAKLLKHKHLVVTGKWDLQFDNQGSKIRYELELKDQKVIMEKYHVGDKCFLNRENEGKGTIYAEKVKSELEFQTPVEELAVVARRDSIQHRYLEPLNEWARNLRLYHFGEKLGKDVMIFISKDSESGFDPSDENSTGPNLHDGVKKYGETFKHNVINDMKEIGYNLTDVKIGPTALIRIKNAPAEPLCVCVEEDGLVGDTDQFGMSSGMFRALSIVIHLNYSLLSGKPSCLIIDDIGEGLDFERSCNLIEVVMNKAKASSVQLIMSTNDRFVMNKVPLEYWSLLVRDAHETKIFNKENSAEIFEEFKFTGLNNFDFFSMDFIGEHAAQ